MICDLPDTKMAGSMASSAWSVTMTAYDNWDLAANNGAVSFQLTQEMLDAAYTVQYWGGVFLANGTRTIITKITVE